MTEEKEHKDGQRLDKQDYDSGKDQIKHAPRDESVNPFPLYHDANKWFPIEFDSLNYLSREVFV